jgi:hypothetical protein
MGTVNGEEGFLVKTTVGDGNCVCWSPQRTEEICACNFANSHVIQHINAGDVMEKNMRPGLQHHKKLNRRVVKQQLQELLIRSDIILENSIRLQIMSHNLLQNSLRLQDLCVIASDNESMSEEFESKIEDNSRMPLECDSITHHNVSVTQENESVTEVMSFGSRSG